MNLRTIIANKGPVLTDSDRKVVDTLMADMRQAVFLPASDVALRAKVHESTVVRLAQKLGFTGYAALRDVMRADLQQLDGAKSHLISLTSESRHDLPALVLSEAQALMRLPDHLSQDELDRAAKMFLDARHVYVYGNPHAAPVSAYFERRLRVLGIHTVPVFTGGQDLAERFASVGAGDLVFMTALQRLPDAAADIIAMAAAVGAQVIVLTDAHGLGIDPSAAVVLLAPRGENSDFKTQVVPQLVCYALQLAIFHLDPVRCKSALAVVDQLRAITSSRTKSANRNWKAGQLEGEL
ncbi:MurR/RpiR family transcriptional regulator [Arthrobacter nitrophenolicus]|uniref:MurR/RpiR family transcriptional regulator n=1 Tax=Arthrobacter nitrophenolicus TaxID=683150 RepID=A0A4R5Y8P1_9MICC|nr:MurR/RpiR family transcriptional regulator [Arthrobacter nitrophenolicus]TDL39685.1 MurR/RpiR family transcriptional regulator [Arthrobacter nitrophenolicus]